MNFTFKASRLALVLLSGLFVFQTSVHAGNDVVAAGGKRIPVCDELLKGIGELTPISNLSEQLGAMQIYLQELAAHHAGRGTTPYVFSTPETAEKLQAAHGPIVTFTTFSRDLKPDEYFRISNHMMGLLSSLPQGGVIVASGGTAGSREDATSNGGGVGIIQPAAMSMGFKTLSITAASAFKYRAAPADYLLFSLGGFGSESRLMYELSPVLIMIGGGGQAFAEAAEYLVYNPKGLLVIIDDPEVGGSSDSLLKNPEFKRLAELHPNIIVSKTGSGAGASLATKLGIKSKTLMENLTDSKINLLSPSIDFHLLQPGSKIIGFSGWSDFSRAGPDLQEKGTKITTQVEKALLHIHHAIHRSQSNRFLYATAGNDPRFPKQKIPAFETMVHNLPENPNTRYLALTAGTIDVKELNSRVTAMSVVAPNWSSRTHQLVGNVDVLITAGGNAAVIDQAIQAGNLQKHHLHISGANTLSDLRISKIKNANLTVMKPEEILKLDDAAILKIMGM